jgi:hypothetical protein
MRTLGRLGHNWRALLATIAALGGLALLWAVRAAPLQPAPFVRVDALSAFFSFALLGSIALAALAWTGALGWRAPAGVALLLIAWNTTLTPVTIGMYLLLALLEVRRPTTDDRRTTTDERRPTTNEESSSGGNRWTIRRIGLAIRRGLRVAPNLVAAGVLLVGYGALAARGGLLYDARTAGAALDSFVFWFVLLAAVVPILDFRFQISDLTIVPQSKIHNLQSKIRHFDLFRIAWLYPLVRLYSLGPWNTGWAFATLLLGGAAALWATLAALTRPADRRVLAPHCFLALALAGLGLGTGAGIAAGCYGVLTYLVLIVGRETRDWRLEIGDLAPRSPISNLQSPISNAHWLLSGAIPLTAPFVAAWMLVGASVAGGVALLAGAAWLVVLLSGLTAALAGAEVEASRRARLLAAGASVALGVGAPLITLLLIQPVIEQLQGGLSPYGDVNIWPWVGLATIDAGHTPVTTLPSIAVAAFMLVLCALVYLIARLRGVWAPVATPGDAPAPNLGALLASLRDEVPWLGALAPRPADEERGVDNQ